MSGERELAPGWLCLAMWLWAQLTAPPCATAQTVRGGARVSTVVDSCVPIDVEQFHRVLAIELGTSIEYSPTAAQQPDGATVRVVCTVAGIQLQLEDSLTRKSMQRVVELPDVDVATRTRLLALSVAEFVVASWVELRLAQPPIATAGPPVPDAAARQASEIAQARLPASQPSTPRAPPAAPARSGFETRWLLRVSIEPVLFAQGASLMPQLSLHIEQRPAPHVSLGLAVSLGHASWDVRWPTLVVGSALVTSSSARLSLAYVESLGSLELSAGAGARGGVVYMAGSTTRADSGLWAVDLYAPWGGPVVLLSAALRVGAVQLALEIEAGYVTLPVEAQIEGTGSVAAELRGLWLAGGLSLGWLF